MNLIIDITISREFSDEDMLEFYNNDSEKVRKIEMEDMKIMLQPLLDDGYKIVMNSTTRHSE